MASATATPSPFPGMDPFLESPVHWSDFHARLINAMADEINEQAPEPYVARINEHVMSIAPTVTEDNDDGDVFMPDVTVISGRREPAAAWRSPRADGGLLTPTVMENVHYIDQHTETFLELIRLPEMSVVTVVELMSPTNKYGDGRGLYMKKRREYLARPVHIVELDLLRAGPRLQFDRPVPAGHYHAFVSRSENRPKTDVYTWTVRDRLPAIPIPLRSPDPDLMLDLGKPFSTAYAAGRYHRLVDYSASPPRPRFSAGDAGWVADLFGKSEG